MVASSDTAKKNKRGRRQVSSSHVAPRGQREKVARPVARMPELTAADFPIRRRRGRTSERRKPAEIPAAMIQRRTDQFDRVFSARMLSAIILLSLGVVLFLLFQSDAFYVRRIEVGGLDHLTAEEVFALSDVANVHLFWIDPEAVRQQVLRSPSVADAEVLVSWPPHLVQIEVQEREPALIWEQAGVRTWIDVRGRVMLQRSDLTGMLRIMVLDVDTPVGPNVIIPQRVVDGALQLHELFPNTDMMIYDGAMGLGYQDPGGWRVWFGEGTNMPAKVNVYNAIVADLEARGIFPEYVDVGNIDAPYYKARWGRDAGPAAEDQSAPPVDS
jgi:cell division septal protein FtsQ